MFTSRPGVRFWLQRNLRQVDGRLSRGQNPVSVRVLIEDSRLGRCLLKLLAVVLQLKGVNSEWFTEISTIKEKQRPTAGVNKKRFLGVFQWQKSRRKNKTTLRLRFGHYRVLFNILQRLDNERSAVKTSLFTLDVFWSE